MKIWEQPHSAFAGREKEMTVILPVGLIEGHGPHLASGSDVIIPQAIAERIDKRLENILIMPSISYGVEKSKFNRFVVAIRPETFENLIKDCLTSLQDSGFEKFVIINGHYANLPIIDKVIEGMKNNSKIVSVNWWDTLSEKTRKLFGEESDYAHAGQLETSVLLGINHELVNFNTENAESTADIKQPFPCTHKCSEYTCYANIERASSSKGQITMEDAVEQIIEKIKPVFCSA